jgi:hypothetical protein
MRLSYRECRVAVRAFGCAAVAALLIGRAVAGGPESEPKEINAPPNVTDSAPWHFTLGSPGWLAGVSGDVGVRGVTSHVDVGFDQLLRHIDGICSLSAEARKGRFGLYADFLYLSVSAAAYNNGLLSKVNLGLDQYLADAEIFYRVLDHPRGWIDLRAGTRYTNIYNSVELVGNSRMIDQAAADFVNALPGDVRPLLERRLQHLLDGRDPSLPIAPLASRERGKLLGLILAAKQNPNPGLAQMKIAKILNKELNRSFSLSEQWLDPYLGIGGRYNLSKVFYLTGKADVGGFGAGSDVTVQASGALGCQLTRSIYSEIGYRYLYADYDSGGFVYRVSTQGVQITTGIVF